MSKWMVSTKKCDFKQIGDELGIDQVVVRVMRNRDMTDISQMKSFLNGSEEIFHSYEYMKDVDKAVDILLDKIDEGARIRIIGDYDVDGIMSTYILWKGLTLCGAHADTVIPHRVRDGYGISTAFIEEAAADGIDTIITCDNGIAATEACDLALEHGITCIITDHHEIPFEMIDSKKKYILPSAPAVIDPKQEDCMYPYKNICGAVVALRVIEALFDAIGEPEDELNELRELAGFATVCDVMELRDENRVLVKNTLKSLKRSKNVGMRALIKVCGLEEKVINSHSIGFILGPCINATGRLDSANLSLKLLQCTAIEDAIVIANELKLLNENRKALTEQGLIKALKIIDDKHISDQKVMVVYMPQLHESLAGIVAGRIKEKYKKPVFVVTDSDEVLKGSARSIPAYHIYEAMTEISDLFVKYGGHAMAAGFSLKKDKLEEFIRRINDNCRLNEEDYEEKIVIDVPMPMRYVTQPLIEQLSYLEPFGLGNEKPVFAEKNVELISCRLMGSMQDMARFNARTSDGFKAELVVFRNANDMLSAIEKKYGSAALKDLMDARASGILMDVIYYPSINEYQGRKTIQFIVGDYK
jgi:single-stranded-DNA-specific exonuclease